MEGTPFGRYRLLELLGRGGMGEVWRAYDTEIDRVVALKMLLPNFAQDHVYEQRFRREARAAARLDDPHVVPIYDVGEIEGRLYVTMRLIKGQDLQSLLDSGPLEPGRAVRIIEQVASALNDAHEAGLVHRDVKPSNVLVGDDDFAYLIDFGIASAAGETGLTNTGTTIGTWSYMAPERFKSGQVGASADVYALACVLYQCLTGQLPYPGDTLEQIAVAHMVAPPPRTSITQPGLPPVLDDVIARGLAKDPAARYSTTTALANDARAAMTAPWPVAPPTWPPHPATQVAHFSAAPATQHAPMAPPTRSARPSRKGIAATAVVGCVVLVGVLTAVLVTGNDVKPEARQADRPSTTSAAVLPPPSTTTVVKPPPDINKLLLSLGEVETLTGLTDVTLLQSGDAPDDTTITTPPECHGLSYSNGVPEYGSSGFTAMRWQVLVNPSRSNSVIEGVTQFPSPQGASALIQKLSPLFESCRGKTVAQKDRASGSAFETTFNSVTIAPDVLTVTHHSRGASTSCQQVKQAVATFVIETNVCAPNITDQAVRLSTAIATGIDNG